VTRRPASLLPRGDIEAIADLVVAKLRQGEAPFPRHGLVDVDQVAALLRVERDWVYDNKTELGAVRIGQGRGVLRFDAAVVNAYVRARRLQDEPRPKRGRPGRRRGRAGDVVLLPAPGERRQR
jgi:hypothetical protein